MRGLGQRSGRIVNGVGVGWKSVLRPGPRISSPSCPPILRNWSFQVSSELSSCFFGWLSLLFISLFRLSPFYTCQSSRPILECTSSQPFFLALYLSSCGPHRAVQGSHPHQWGQSVSCVYLMQRWRLFQGLSLYYPPMSSP